MLSVSSGWPLQNILTEKVHYIKNLFKSRSVFCVIYLISNFAVMDEYETVILVKQEVFVYKIPPRTTNRGYRAADWKLDTPDWTGRMRVVSKGKECFIKLEDKTTGELFSKSPIEKYPGIALEAVMDSSRYFVLRIEADNGPAAFIGIGFADRSDSFDLNVALQEHFKWLQKSEEIEQGADSADSKPNLDLSFKAGETIKINMNIGKKSGSSKPRPKPSSSGALPGLLPPPPGGVKIPSTSVNKTPQAVSPVVSVSNSEKNTNSASDLLLDLGSPINTVTMPVVTSSPAVQKSAANELWGDFTTATTHSTNQNTEPTSANWMNF